MKSKSKSKRRYKIIILGDGAVGKSALTIQLLKSKFVEEYDPTIEDSYLKQIVVDDELIMLDIIDTAGQEEYGTMRDQSIFTGDGYLIVYSISSRSTFEDIPRLLDLICDIKKSKPFSMILIGNKCDLEEKRQVSKYEGHALAKEYHCKFLETSAKESINIDKAFITLVREIKDGRPNLNLTTLKISNWPNEEKASLCCIVL